MDLSDCLAIRRCVVGLSQRGLALALGLHPSVLRLWESGERPVPGRRLWPLAAALGCSVLDLLEGGCDGPHVSRADQDGWSDEAARRPRTVVPPPCEPWTPREDDRLRALAGTMPVREVAERLDADLGAARTPAEVRGRAGELSVSLAPRGLRLREVAALFGVADETIVAHWIAAGLLSAANWEEEDAPPFRWVRDADLEAFVRQHPWAYKPRSMRPGHRLTQLAEVCHRRATWVPLAEAAGWLRAPEAAVAAQVAAGALPHRVRHGYDPTGQGELLVPADALFDLRERLQDASAARRAA